VCYRLEEALRFNGKTSNQAVRTTIIKSFAVLLILVSIAIASILFSPDPLSKKLRSYIEININEYIEALADRAAQNRLTSTDKQILTLSVWTGVTLSKFQYPEAALLLDHYVNGDGVELELDSEYFETSEYLASVITNLGVGDHGPLALRQSQDWRLSLAFNPYYLKITCERVKLYHPNISFASVQSTRAHTLVPIGKLKIKVIDNLVTALSPTPFAVFSEWVVEGRYKHSACINTADRSVALYCFNSHCM